MGGAAPLRKGSAAARLQRLNRKRFDHGRPIARIDTRPMVFVMVFLVIVIAIGRYPLPDFEPAVELPFVVSQPVARLDDQFVVTVTTTSIQKGRKGWNSERVRNHGECFVFVGQGEAVNSRELVDIAFQRLDMAVTNYSDNHIHPPRYPDGLFTALVRADARVPWQCIGGVIYNLEAAGYDEVKFLTTPVV